MSSSAAITITGKDFGSNGAPGSTDVAGKAVFKKKLKGTTFSLSISDATLKAAQDGKALKDLVVTGERKLADDVKVSLAYDVGIQKATATGTIDKKIGEGGLLTLKATYRQKDDALILDETWKLDKKSKVTGSYNFRSEEAIAAYTYSDKGWTATAGYNFSKEAPKLTVSKKQDKHTVEAVWEPKAEAAQLSWSLKPLKVVLKGKAGKGGVKAQSLALTATQEFDL